MQHSALTHIGLVRTENQDRHAVFQPDPAHLLLVLSDGMGGEAGGALAAETVINTLDKTAIGPITDPNPEETLAQLTVEAGERILEKARADQKLEGLGATAVAVLLGPGRAHWVNLGDSRLYHLGKGGLRQVSTDHSFIQELLDAGDLTREEARRHPMRHVLDQCAGTPGAEPDTGGFDLAPGDVVLLCSDGLHGYVTDEQIADILGDKTDLDGMARSLVDAALSAGGRDNITVVLARV